MVFVWYSAGITINKATRLLDEQDSLQFVSLLTHLLSPGLITLSPVSRIADRSMTVLLAGPGRVEGSGFNPPSPVSV